ncbi:MAG: monovalent cation/H+ antiporter complex subunit F [Phenylobacterium sp.]|nr:monovalent cation/H+ antiporter complex subunit F [Phenylobacterium sp.]
MNLWRLARGPTTADRILALDTMTINAIALMVLMQIQQGSAVYFEADHGQQQGGDIIE